MNDLSDLLLTERSVEVRKVDKGKAKPGQEFEHGRTNMDDLMDRKRIQDEVSSLCDKARDRRVIIDMLVIACKTGEIAKNPVNNSLPTDAEAVYDKSSFLGWCVSRWDRVTTNRHFLRQSRDDVLLEMISPNMVNVKTIATGNSKTTSKRHEVSNRHKKLAREKAKEMWKKDPDLTIESIVNSPGINEAVGKTPYTEKAIRKWIKDLCPNPKPGRRPKTPTERSK